MKNILTLFIAASALLIAGCPVAGPPEAVNVGITLDSTGTGTAYAAVETSGSVSTVTVEASPSTGFVFGGWFDAETGGNLTSGDNPYSFTMPTDEIRAFRSSGEPVIYAAFGLPGPETYVFGASVDIGSSGKGTLDTDLTTPAGEYDEGTTVSAVAVSGAEYYFVGWYDSGDRLLSGEETYSATLLADLDLRAVFGDRVSLTVGIVSGLEGTGTAQIDPEETLYVPGETVTFEARPDPGYIFAGWYDAAEGGAQVSNDPSYTADAEDGFALYASFAMDMVDIAGGSFAMGDSWEDDYSLDAEIPVHDVTVGPFRLGRYEITNEQLCRALNYGIDRGYLAASGLLPGVIRRDDSANGNTKVLLDVSDSTADAILLSLTDGHIEVEEGWEDLPVYYISWHGAVVFCNFLSEMEGLEPVYNLSDWSIDWTANGYRLPTEAEWAFAARGGVRDEDPYAADAANGHEENSQYAGGDADTGLDDVAWTAFNSDDPGGFVAQPDQNLGPHPIGGLLPNELGVYDMIGNVYEWCWDWWAEDYYVLFEGTPPEEDGTNPLGPDTGDAKVFRGGYWGRGTDMNRIAVRHGNNPQSTVFYIGLRVVRNAE